VQRVFIDGQAGTTGLEIASRLSSRCDVELLCIADDDRKDPEARRALLNEADLVILCLPDNAAVEAVALLDNPRTKVLDASTAHRVATDWIYGLPELDANQRQRIQASRRVSNPGCYATGFILAARPLVDAGVLAPDAQLATFAISGYSGGGRAMIESQQAHDRSPSLGTPRGYSLNLNHKHLPEMTHFAGLANPPLFTPIVGDYYKGMVVYLPLNPDQLARQANAADIHALLAERYQAEPCINVVPLGAMDARNDRSLSDGSLSDGFLSPIEANDTNRLDLMVFGEAGQTLIAARFDNLGKGASGAAVQNLNLMLGMPESNGLVLK
jgi:N-acetyl-gamma-glutamyl-phosphate reductase